MKKIVSLLGGEEAVWRTIGMLLLTVLSLAFAAGTYFGNAKDLPARVDVMERKQDRVETKLEAILNKVDGTSADVRELRAVILQGQRR